MSVTTVPIVLYWYDTIDPIIAPGAPAPLGQLLVRTDVPGLYYKSGQADTDWVQLANGPIPPSTNQQAFRYVCTGAEGSDFFIPLPVARANDLYLVFGSLASVTNIFGWNFQNTAAADRTTLQFRVITTIAVTAGDVFELSVQDPI